MSIASILLFCSLFFVLIHSQADGNPHNWDRKRRCDQDYNPPCQICEGVGGIVWGDENDEISITGCLPIANSSQVKDPKRPDWANKWYTPEYYSILIGKKNDPFCFQTFPSNDSVGALCYQRQQGPQAYDMEEFYALRYDVQIATVVGNLTSEVLAQGPYLWVVNKFPWYAAGVHQCVCTQPREGGDPTKPAVYPLQYNWTDLLSYVGREFLDIEYVWESKVELDHWMYGPHHIWTVPDSGKILRMWQPFNGLQVFPFGTGETQVDASNFTDAPPALCKKKGGATFRIKCDDNGYPTNEEEEIEASELARAHQPTPAHNFRGENFEEMSRILNGHLTNSGVKTKECEDWALEEIQQLQYLLHSLRHEEFDRIYKGKNDNRKLRHHEHHTIWEKMNKFARKHDLEHVLRDGHCHEAVMWYVHHTTQDIKEKIIEKSIFIPLLAYDRHDCPDDANNEEQAVYDTYEHQVTCADCHSDVKPEKSTRRNLFN